MIKIEKAREMSIQILDKFEKLLDRKGIKIPSEDRETKPEQACLYGSEYDELEDFITDILKNHLISEHKEIILEALNDYRIWFKDDPDASDLDKIKRIDKAVEALEII